MLLINFALDGSVNSQGLAWIRVCRKDLIELSRIPGLENGVLLEIQNPRVNFALR
jgi:hypothetical protein